MGTYEVFGRKPDGHRLWLYSADRDQAHRAKLAGLVVITTHAAIRDYGEDFKSKGASTYARPRQSQDRAA